MKPVDLERLRKLAGGLPVNPLGSCFDATGAQFLHAIREILDGVSNPPMQIRAVHGIGIANMPGQEGTLIGHAWLEFICPFTHKRLALECVWNKIVTADQLHRDLKVRFCVKYGFDDFMKLWAEYNHPGPWHPKIVAVVEGAQGGVK